jgi:hypothetical protein
MPRAKLLCGFLRRQWQGLFDVGFMEYESAILLIPIFGKFNQPIALPRFVTSVPAADDPYCPNRRG